MTPLIAFHTASALGALLVGIAVLLRAKGTATHKVLGRIWVGLMTVTAVTSFWIMEIRDGAGWSPIHALSIVTLIALARAVWAIRNGRVRTHQINMLSAFAGTAIAGAFTLLPNRILGLWLFGG